MGGRRAEIEARVERDWGLELPESVFTFHDFLEQLDPVSAGALRDLGHAPMGVMDLFADPALLPRDGVDVRAHGRYYRDPPEFLTFLHGGTDGLHYGLWFDDGRTCTSVASYWNNDGAGIDNTFATPLEAVRAAVERAWRDLDDDDPGHPAVIESRSRLVRLRSAVGEFETGDRPETGTGYLRAYTHDLTRPPVATDRITTLDGAGALADGTTALDRPAHNAADEYLFATHMDVVFEDREQLAECVTEARRRCAAGDPAEALVLGRDLHWASYGDPVREAHAQELLASAYRALGRPALAGIAEAHHLHRALRSVDLLDRSPATG
ncbi:hypothetical protein AB0D08_19710 [Kitasatospora sp. NPDC048540]|uniref:hypothetical protein n=1 Tax=Kitasatospora sp. NPDC048540 TaxID=3155634 RepID=UPI0034106275